MFETFAEFFLREGREKIDLILFDVDGTLGCGGVYFVRYTECAYTAPICFCNFIFSARHTAMALARLDT